MIFYIQISDCLIKKVHAVGLNGDRLSYTPPSVKNKTDHYHSDKLCQMGPQSHTWMKGISSQNSLTGDFIVEAAARGVIQH